MLKVYLANLGKYVEGYLVGKWVELPCDDIAAELKSIGVAERMAYEEYAIHDYECDIRGIEIDEYSNIGQLNELAERLAELYESDKEHLAAFMEAICSDLEYALDNYTNHTFYANKSLEELAEEFVEDGCWGDIPEGLINYIDYGAIARDLSCDYTETDYGVISA